MDDRIGLSEFPFQTQELRSITKKTNEVGFVTGIEHATNTTRNFWPFSPFVAAFTPVPPFLNRYHPL